MRFLVTDVDTLGTLSALPTVEECEFAQLFSEPMLSSAIVVHATPESTFTTWWNGVIETSAQTLSADLDVHDRVTGWAQQPTVTRVMVSDAARSLARRLYDARRSRDAFYARAWSPLFGASDGHD